MVILSDNIPLALAITKGRPSSSHLVQSCRVVCANSLFCNIAIQARWIASESNLADVPSRQKWIDARTTRAPGEEGPTTKSRLTPAQACLDTAVATRSAHTEPSKGVRAGSDGSELRQEHRDSHEVETFDSDATTTRRHTLSQLPPLGLLRSRVSARRRVGHGSHSVCSGQTFRAQFR